MSKQPDQSFLYCSRRYFRKSRMIQVLLFTRSLMGIIKYLLQKKPVRKSFKTLQTFKNLKEILSDSVDVHSTKIKSKKCVIYLDDVLIFGNTIEGHTERQEQMLTRIRKLAVLKKCLLKIAISFITRYAI